ncbi:MAG: L-serine ammonia-lyase, iron-sulfur-dependent, subunit alpha [Oscillospiraceae bacterium]|nr:L-serine ammonia-lyase, iron-sulfur-dependent, subunit alpha [Oscillospiraceae bacterium]
MKSLTNLYRIGRGPSSSHTIGPERAALYFKQKNPDAEGFSVTLYGSLAKTGKGHMTDAVLRQTLAPVPSEIIFDYETDENSFYHPNAMDMRAFKNGEETDKIRVYSIGGGEIAVEGTDYVAPPEVYYEESFDEIAEYCREHDIRIWEYVERMEGPRIWDYLEEVWNQMKRTIKEGLKSEGVLAGGLGVQRKAAFLYNQYHMDESAETKENRIVCSYAFAVGEQNASNGTVVTAPTCGAAGVMPAVLYYWQKKRKVSDTDILHALATGGIIGNLIKTNASISGAECGCQAEIGTACCMASAALAEICGMSLDQIEYAAEVSMEHMLGLTCDPIDGLVQIPCIERNAVAAMRSINAISLANFLTHTRKISFDTVVKTMYETGKDIKSRYRETSEGGLAKHYCSCD